MIDFGKAHHDYTVHRVDFAPQLFTRLAAMGAGIAGQRILDLGSGTGLLAKKLRQNGCLVTLADQSETLLRCSDQQNRIAAIAEELPFADESFDIVTAAQCWHWFDRNRAPREMLRILKPGGAIAAVYQTYIPLPGGVAEATEKLILQHRPGWRHANSAGVNGQVLRDVQSAGFVEIESFSFDLSIPFTRESWRGFIRTTSPIGASMSADQVERFDQDHEQLLHRWPKELAIPHRVFAAVAQKPIMRLGEQLE